MPVISTYMCNIMKSVLYLVMANSEIGTGSFAEARVFDYLIGYIIKLILYQGK